EVRPIASRAAAYRVDTRQLSRWNLSARNLPDNTVLLFREPTMWEQHRTLVLTTLAVLLLMSVTLAALLSQVNRRKKIQAHLRESEERLGFAAASAGIGLWQYDAAADVLWSSEHCRGMFGLPSKTPLTTKSLMEAVHPDDRAVALASIRAATLGTLAE